MKNITDIVDAETADAFDPDLRKAFEVSDNVERDYKKVKIEKDSILLSGDKTFYTLQGEGPTIGLPCVFVRLHVCNLKCVWCDAFYTWKFDSKEFWTESTRMGFQQLALQIYQTWGGRWYDEGRVIWTGGEPLIQKKQIDTVANYLLQYGGWAHEVETNGTLMPTDKQLDTFQFNCSPKLANSQNHHHSMVRPKILEALNAVNTTFKFVCRDENDLNEIEDKYFPHISHEKIVIMPEGITEAEITPNARVLYEPVLRRGWRMTPRFQAIFADGARRGI